ncbi:hypothetical protein OT109_14715 [Phycisphaeraceae bacterium D3-23]
MPRTFSHVDQKLAESEFFLERVRDSDCDSFGIRCYVSAFASSARSVTFALQSSMTGVKGFGSWYKRKQENLRGDKLARFFHEFRRINQHVGDNLVKGFSSSPGNAPRYSFHPTQDVPWVPQEDVATACQSYFVVVLSTVFDCYIDFGPEIDAQQRYTHDYFVSQGKTIEDAEEELGYPRGWTDIGKPDLEPYRWELLRRQAPGCEINHLFDHYLDKVTPCIEKLPPLKLTVEDGWYDSPLGGKVYIPEEFRIGNDAKASYAAYTKSLQETDRNRRASISGDDGSVDLFFDE